MTLGALPALGAVTLALTASASPLAEAPPAAPRVVVSRAPARTVFAAIARARALGALPPEQARDYRAQWGEALAARALPGARGALVAQSVASARSIAAAGTLGAGRLALVLAGVHASTEVARSSVPLPLPTGRVQIPGDSAVYTYRPPYGLQVHPLGTSGKVNALASTCTGRKGVRARGCRVRALRAAATRLAELGVPAGSTLRFEYLFAFGVARPGWVSGMTQATAAQALARTYEITGERRFIAAARGAYLALTRPTPRGAAVVGANGLIARFAMYTAQPGLRVLNGEEQTLIGLADFARIARDRVAARLARRAARELATRLPGFDTGAWTLYDLGGPEASLEYHELAADFARGVCDRALADAFCPAAARFARYTVEPPRLYLDAPARVQARRVATLVIGASKQSSARVVVRDADGRVVYTRVLALGRTGARLPVAMTRPGAYTVALGARAVNGRSASRTAALTVTAPPKPKPKPKPKPEFKPSERPDAHRRPAQVAPPADATTPAPSDSASPGAPVDGSAQDAPSDAQDPASGEGAPGSATSTTPGS